MAEIDAEVRLSRAFLEFHAVEAARVLEGWAAAEVAPVLADVGPRVAASVLQRMTPASAGACLAELAGETVNVILGKMPLESGALLLRTLTEKERSTILESLSRAESKPIRRLLTYPEGTVGAVMDPNIFTVANDVTVSAAGERLRMNPGIAIYYVYVTDRGGRLVGVLTLRELMIAAPELPVVSIMQREPVCMRAAGSHLDLIQHVGWRKFHAIPVVDETGVLLGIVRYETLRKLEGELAAGERRRGGVDLALTLSELYVRGLTGLVGGLLSRPVQSSELAGKHDEEES